MDQSLELKNEPTNSTTSDRLKIPTEMQLNSVKQESDCLVQSAIYIKTETQEDESEFPVIADTSDEVCPDEDNEFKMYEPIVNIVMENSEVEIMLDPLAVKVNNEIKDEEHIPIDFDRGEAKIKTGGEKDEDFLKIDKDYSHGSGSNQGQDQVFIGNDSDCKDKMYVCNECNKKFNRKWDFDRHLRIHTGEKPFSCDICKKSFIEKGALTKHMIIHSGEKSHVCNVCKKVFSRKAHLDVHMLIHSGVKQFLCKECNKSFALKHNFVVHKRIHTGERPFACDACEKAFGHKSDLTKHKRIHTGEKPYSCNICNKSFAEKATLNKHKKTHKK